MDEEWARWRSCVRRYFRRRVRDPDAVDDLVQETCVRAWISHRKGRVDQLALRWLLGISWRLLADRRRAYFARRPPTKLEPTPELADVVAEPRERTVSIDGRPYRLSHVLRILDECVEELPATVSPLMRDRMRGQRMKAIARLHGLGENVVKLRLHRGRRKLRQAMLHRLREEDEDVAISCS